MKIKAISLISGGLDSTLATRVILEQGIEVTAVNFTSPFCCCNRKAGPSTPLRAGCRQEAMFVSQNLGIPLETIPNGEDFLEVVRAPKHGYGSNMNPCVDCRILMFKKAKLLMTKLDASFIISGEVVGQRPMSQKIPTLRLIEKEAGLCGLVLRPLSARLLEPTLAEERGWVNREKLLSISGRGRRPQIKMAADFGLNDYPCPAGGCLLTDPAFSRRAREAISHDEWSMAEVGLLKIGRHFRLPDKAKLVVGRNERENAVLAGLAVENDVFLKPADIAGASGLARGVCPGSPILTLAGSILARYCDKDNPAAEIRLSVERNGAREDLRAQAAAEEVIKRYLI